MNLVDEYGGDVPELEPADVPQLALAVEQLRRVSAETRLRHLVHPSSRGKKNPPPHEPKRFHPLPRFRSRA